MSLGTELIISMHAPNGASQGGEEADEESSHTRGGPLTLEKSKEREIYRDHPDAFNPNAATFNWVEGSWETLNEVNVNEWHLWMHGALL